MKEHRIGIIGGGFTGLTAAYELSKHPNIHVTVVEKSDALGGLAGDFLLQGAPLEKTYHHLFRNDTDILTLIAELGLQNKLMWCESSVGIFYEGQTYPFTSATDVLRFKPCSFLSRLRLGVVALYLQKRRDWREFVGITAYEWMLRFCGRECVKVIWEPLLRGKFDRYFNAVSMAWLWARIHIRANSRESTRGSEKLAYLRGGFAEITKKLESEIRNRGVEILIGTAVESIAADAGKVCVATNGTVKAFEQCIFTGPSAVFSNLIGAANPQLNDYLQQLNAIDYLGAVCLVFASDQDIGDFYWLNINQVGAPFLVFINHTKLIDKQLYNGKHVYYIGSYQPHDSSIFSRSDEDITRQWLGFLKQIYPEFDPGQIVEQCLFKLKFAQHIVDPEYPSKIPDYRTPLSGVYLVNFSQIFPEDRGTNYAVREGRKIAQLLLDEVNGGNC